jgi:hypothetical protein
MKNVIAMIKTVPTLVHLVLSMSSLEETTSCRQPASLEARDAVTKKGN